MADAEEFELIDYLVVLWKWKGLILAGTFMAALTAFFASVRAPLLYEAAVTLQIVARGEQEKPSWSRDTFVEIITRKNQSLAAEAVQQFGLDRLPFKVSADEFASRLIRVKPIGETYLIVLTVTLPDSGLAAKSANFLAQRVVELTAQLNQGDVTATGNYFQQRLQEARKTLEASHAALMDFKRKSNLRNLLMEQQILSQEKARLTTRSAEISSQQAGLRTWVEELSGALTQREPIPTSKDPIIPDPPLVPRPQEQDVEKDIIHGKASLASLEGERKELERKTQEVEKRLGELEQRSMSAEPKLEALTRSYTLALEVVGFRTEKADEEAISNAKQAPRIKIVDPAIVPKKPVGRTVIQKTAIAALIGLVGSSMLAFLVESLTTARRRET